MLLIGAPGSGKTLVAQAVAHSVGAALFDLSPKNTDGKWPGKAAATMVSVCRLADCITPDCQGLFTSSVGLSVPVHIPTRPASAVCSQQVSMVVRCAKLLQPSVVYIDEAEKVSLQLIVVVG